MMLSRPQLLSVLAFLALAQASWLDGFSLINRQNGIVNAIAAVESSSDLVPSDTAKNTGDSKPTITSPTPTPSASPSKSASASPTPTPTTTPPTTKPTSTPPTSSEDSETPSATTSPDAKPTTESKQPPKSTKEVTSTPSVNVITQVLTVSGSVVTSVSSSTNTNSASAATNEASLAGNGEKSSGGMSSKTKNTVIGVVVGVGGAIILAGLGVVAWRIWGRKKKGDESDDLMGYRASSAAGEKTTAQGPAANPFQSTLENYHNPARNVNASSNF
ncbi:uncharacterized protein BP5553_00858 [Venustampulla echinocandica]|uniref:Mid2 domain-containing protein n=1 Tax=Venustampulla echinocandica TaxID=2656787 RepID=A0A370TZC8_9HELO|nr:uncharacterized protein BP5553_00858 [Venustampulla echinocandica]RDL40879.1 hypothetical protein BP5553_00858 [Venustampulla echinocandica]